jgi:hypothetical protein
MKILKLHRNSDPKNQPPSSSRLIINMNINYEFGSNTTEDGFDVLVEYPSIVGETGVLYEVDKTCIGSILLPDNSICLFSNYTDEGPTPGFTEIGILNNKIYKPVLRGLFNCDEKFPIEGTSKINNKGETIIYWTDFKNGQRWLNLTNPQVTVLPTLLTSEIDKLLYFPPTESKPVLLNQVLSGGSLPTGVYIPVYKYADNNYNDTNVIFNSSVISIGDGSALGNQYDGAAPNTISGKSIQLKIENPDPRYSYIHLYLVYKAESVYVVYDCGYKIISTPTTITINNLDNLSTVPLDAILIPSPNYKTAKTVTQLDSVMYWGNLKDREVFDFQPYINNIRVNPGSEKMDTQSFWGTDYRNEIQIYNKKGFMYGEVYAMYASFNIEDEFGSYETKAYHIPGRRAEEFTMATKGGSGLTRMENAPCIGTTFGGSNDWLWGTDGNGNIVTGGGINDVTPGGEMYRVNNNAKLFHAFPTGYIVDKGNPSNNKMGYWENENETYTNTSNWLVKDENGTTTNNIQSENVRHHKFPHASKSPNVTGTPEFFHNKLGGITSNDYAETNILYLNLSNIVIPTQFVGKIKSINIYYAKRTQNNKTILGQSIALHDGYLWNQNTSQEISNITTHLGGNINIYNQNSQVAGGPGDILQIKPNKKFIRSSPFDIVSTDTYRQPDYINVLYNISNTYEFVSDTGNSNPGRVTNPSVSCRHKWVLDNAPAGVDINPVNLNIFNRKIKVSNYIESVPSYPTTAEDLTTNAQYPYVLNNSAQYRTSKSIYHYRADKVVLMELENKLDDPSSPQVTFEYNQDITEGRLADLTNNNLETTPSEIYLVNLCVFKSDIYSNFDSQELVFAGNSEIITNQTNDIWGGDTFSNYYGYVSASDIAGVWNEKMTYEWKWLTFELKFLHYFICQSVSNINYRNNGTSTYDTYFPFTSAYDLSLNPLVPNGEANYYNYNKAYSSVNDLHQPIIAEMIPKTENSEFPTRIIRTGKDNNESIYDNYRVVLPNDYLDLSKDKGDIWSLKGAFNKLSIFFENTYKETLGRERILTESAESYVGAGDIFAVYPKDILTVDGGYAGSVSQKAITVTPYGIFYADINRGKIFLRVNDKQGDLEEISAADMFYFFRDELKFKFYEQLKKLFNDYYLPFVYGNVNNIGDIVKYSNAYYKCINTTSEHIPTDINYWIKLFDEESIPIEGLDSLFLGLKSVYDAQYKRVILNKTDLIFTNDLFTLFDGIPVEPTINKIYFVDNQLKKWTGDYYEPISYSNRTYFNPIYWTISYYPEYKAWGSLLTYNPSILFNSNDSVYSVARDEATGGIINKLYKHNEITIPIFYEWSVNGSTIEAVFNEAPDDVKEWKSIQFKTKASLFKDNLSSQEYLETFDNYQTYNSYQLSKQINIVNKTNARNIEGYWSINNFRDWFNNGTNIFTDAIYLFLNSVNPNKHFSKLKRMVDNWLTVRFNYNNYKLETLPVQGGTLVSQVNVNAPFDYYIKITKLNTLNINDILNLYIISIDFNSRGIVYKEDDNYYYIKLINKVTIEGGVELTTIDRFKRIKLSLLEVTSTFIKNNR